MDTYYLLLINTLCIHRFVSILYSFHQMYHLASRRRFLYQSYGRLAIFREESVKFSFRLLATAPISIQKQNAIYINKMGLNEM